MVAPLNDSTVHEEPKSDKVNETEPESTHDTIHNPTNEKTDSTNVSSNDHNDH